MVLVCILASIFFVDAKAQKEVEIKLWAELWGPTGRVSRAEVFRARNDTLFVFEHNSYTLGLSSVGASFCSLVSPAIVKPVRTNFNRTPEVLPGHPLYPASGEALVFTFECGNDAQEPVRQSIVIASR